MTLRQLIRRLFAVLVMAGLVLSPFFAPTAATAMRSEAVLAMAGDMSGCPSEQPAPADCQKTCPLMAACAANWVESVPASAISILVPGVKGDVTPPGNDAFGGPLAEDPPTRPPRI